jgi:hypothetical protein
MQMSSISFRAFSFVIGIAALLFSGWACADPPSRVARLGYVSGPVSFSPAGEADWVQASINRPLTTGDRLWADARGRTEIQVGGAMIRMHAGTGVAILNLDDRIVQLQLTQGTLNVRVRRLGPRQVFEVDTPNLAFTLRSPGDYRIVVEPDGSATTIVMRAGQGEAYGDGAAYLVDSRQPFRFSGTGLREFRYVSVPRPDEFDRWCSDRDRRYDSSVSARYVSQDVLGYQDLDANGTWRVDATYGNVWFPSRVATGWAPYRDGHWAWVDPWGWTWVDDAPWGFAVSHYGRWTNLRGSWGWVPGPMRTAAWYAPALVVFLGGDNFQLTLSSGNVGGVGWFPLAPREVYRPSYPVSRGYFENVNRSNTVINTTVINNYYNNTNVTNIVYANRQVPGAVVAVPTTAFVQSQPVSRAAVRVAPEAIVSRPVALAPPVSPTEKSVRGATATSDKPPAKLFERPVVARTAPPAAHAGFAAQLPQLAAKPGQPLGDAARKELKPAPTAPAPVVKVVPQAQQSPPQRPPPAAQPAEQRGQADQRAITQQRGQPAAPPSRGAAQPKASPSPAVSPTVKEPAPAADAPPRTQAAPSMPAAQPQEQRGRAQQRSEQPIAPPLATPRQGAGQPRVASPAPAAPAPVERPAAQKQPAPAAQAPEQRGRGGQAVPEPRARAEQRGQPGQAPPQSSVQPRVAAPMPVAPAAPVRQPELRPPAAPPAARQAEPRPAAAPPAQAQREQRAQPHAREPRPAASKPNEKGRDGDEKDRK